MLHSGGQNQTWPTSGPNGYITPTVWGSPMLQSGGQNQKWPTSGPRVLKRSSFFFLEVMEPSKKKLFY